MVSILYAVVYEKQQLKPPVLGMCGYLVYLAPLSLNPAIMYHGLPCIDSVRLEHFNKECPESRIAVKYTLRWIFMT